MKKSKAVLLLLTVFTLMFIFSNSLPDIETSKAESEGIMELIEPFLELFVGKGNVTLHMVRKLAHFTEFGMLGFVLGLFTGKPKSGVFLFTLLTALTDETIQLFTGRGSQVKDVWIDFAGGCTGIIAGIILLSIVSKFMKKTKQEESK